MSDSFEVAAGRLRVVKEGVTRLDTDDAHMIVLSRVVGSFVEPQRDGYRTPAINNNINVVATDTIDTCHADATHLIGALRLVPAAGDGAPFGDSPFPAGFPYSFMGGTFIWVHSMNFLSSHTIFVDSGSVRVRRNVQSSVPAPSSGITSFGIRGFTLHYSLRAIRFL